MPTRKTKGTLPSGSIRYQLYIGMDENGKRQYKSFTAPRKSDAKKMAEDWLREHQKQPQNASNLSFYEAAEDFLANRKGTLSPRTYAEYLRQINWIKREYPTFAKTRLCVMSSEKVQELISSMATRKKEKISAAQRGNNQVSLLSAKSISNYYMLIDTILLTHGVELRNVKLPQQKKTELVIPENQVVTELLQKIKGTEMEVPVLLAAWGPMRRGEICALRMEDIDFGTNSVHVCRNMVLNSDNEWIIKAPKTTSGERTIIYPSYVLDLIKEHGYIYNGNPNTLTARFTNTLQRNGMEHFRFHDLRHFAASFQIALGIPPEYVMERGGWHSPGTMQRYVHALDEQRRQMADKANEAFSKLM